MVKSTKKKHRDSRYRKRDLALQRLLAVSVKRGTPSEDTVEMIEALDDLAAAHVAATLEW
jgi:hypothetical protein